MTLLNRIFCFLAWILTVHAVSAQTLPIYVAPATDHSPVARASVSGNAIAKVTPVLEAAKKAEGWYWAEYTGPFEGFIAKRDFGNEERPRLGAIVYAEARVESPVVTTVEEGDQSSLSEHMANGAFVRISLSKTIGVYFNAKLSGMQPPKVQNTYVRRSTNQSYDSPARVVQPPPVVASAPPPVVASTPRPAPKKVPAPSYRRNLPKTQVTQAQPKPKPAPAPVLTPVPQPASPRPQVRSVAPPKPAPSPPRAREVSIIERKIPLPPVVIDNSIILSGKLVQTKRRWLLIKPETPFMLVDHEGERIAWLDLENSGLSRPLPDLLGADVVVYGEWRKREGNAKVILQARNVRLAF